MEKLTLTTRVLLAVITVGSAFGAVRTYGHNGPRATELKPAHTDQITAAAAPNAPAGSPGKAGAAPVQGRPVRVALSQWPGHMALLVGAGGLRTTPGSIAAAEGLDLEIQ